MFKWLHTTEDISAGPMERARLLLLPEFLRTVEAPFFEIGQQLRILSKVQTELRTEAFIVQSIQDLAEAKNLELIAACQKWNDEWALCEAGFCSFGFGYKETKLDKTFPLPFLQSALHEVSIEESL